MKHFTLYQPQIVMDVLKGIQEDLGSGDITGQLIPESKQAEAKIITRETMIFCGQLWAEEVFNSINPTIMIQWHYAEGDEVPKDAVLCNISGSARDILSGERMALNFIQTLSAVSTKTHEYVQQVSGLNTVILDTRKTIPGLRYAQKYAVYCGGGQNHRYGLYDAFLIKENHIAASGSIKEVIQKARDLFPEKKLEIEIETLAQLKEAISANPDIIMLDNFVQDDLKMVHEAIAIRAQLKAEETIKFEVSGNVNLGNIRKIAETGVDFISVGALTKNIQAIDLTLLLQ